MTRETQTVWKSSKGIEILRHKHGDTFYMPLSDCSTETLRELRDAISEAIDEPLLTALKNATKGQS